MVDVSDATASEEVGDAGDTGGAGSGRGLLSDRDIRTYLQIGGLGVALLFALVAATGFYTSTRRAIEVWVSRPYQPVFAAGFNLVVLLAMLAVIIALLRRVE